MRHLCPAIAADHQRFAVFLLPQYIVMVDIAANDSGKTARKANVESVKPLVGIGALIWVESAIGRE